ncbi:MAG: hypothetical protein ACRCR1_04405, partial [Aeromonas sp.]
SSGNAVLSVAQQLAISFGIASGASILSLFKDSGLSLQSAFHHTYLTVALITLLSGLVFLLLKKDDGANMHRRQEPVINVMEE